MLPDFAGLCPFFPLKLPELFAAAEELFTSELPVLSDRALILEKKSVTLVPQTPLAKPLPDLPLVWLGSYTSSRIRAPSPNTPTKSGSILLM